MTNRLPCDIDQSIIDELDTVYKHIGRITYYNQFVPPNAWDCNTQALLASNVKRGTELTKYLTDAGYEYDWYKGWTKEMVTTPLV